MLLFLYTSVSLSLVYLIYKRRLTTTAITSFMIAVIIRLIVLVVFVHSMSDDLGTFIRDGHYFLEGKNQYESSYFPFASYLSATVLFLQEYIQPAVFLKLVFLFFDSLIVFPISILSKRQSNNSLLYAVNPITVIISVVHGQIDALPLFFFLLTIALIKDRKELLGVLIFSMAISIKTWPLLFVIPLIRRSRNLFLYLLLPLFPAVMLLIYSLFSPVLSGQIMYKIISHKGIFGEWGYSKFIVFLLNHRPIPTIETVLSFLFLLFFVVFSLLRKDKDLLKNILIIMLFFFVATPTFGIQWFSWLVPFVLLVRPKQGRLFFLIAAVYLTVGFVWDADPYFRSIMPVWNSVITRVGIITWFFMAIMFFYNLKGER